MIQIPTRIQDALHRFTTHVPTPALTQVSVQSKIRALHAIIKQTGFPAALMLHRKLARFQMSSFFIHRMPVSTSHQTETQQVHVFCCEGHNRLWSWRFTLNQTTEQW